jgi:arylsulfatase A-like enzyme
MAPRPDAPPAPPAWNPPTILAVAAACGLAAGLVEVLSHTVRSLLFGRILAFGRDYFWMTPLGEFLVFLALGLVVIGLAVLIRPLRRPAVVLALFGGLAVFAPLLLVDQIHKAASAVLALGVGVALARTLAPRAGRVGRVATRLVPVLLAVLLAIGVVMVARRRGTREEAAGARAAGPNVLLLVLDTVRAWDVGWMGYYRPTTPRLSEWVAQGAMFNRMLATSPWTAPSHGSMFTGHLPTEISVNWDTPLDRRQPTLAEVMRDAGYATAGFVGNYRYAGSATGLDRGFGHYDDYPVTVEQVLRSAQIPARIFALPGVAERLGERRILHGGANAGDLNRRFLRWVAGHGDRPFFAFINYFEGHAPYLPPAPWDSLFLRARDERAERYWDAVQQIYGPGPFPREFLRETRDGYDGSIAYLDFEIDSLLTELQQRGVLQNTVVIITSDHGEHFGEHGLVQHGSSLYLPVLNVPFAIRAPGRVPAGAAVNQPTSLRHLAATVLDLAGVRNPGLPGRSLMRWFDPGPDAAPAADTLFAAVDASRLLPKWPPNQPILRGDLRTVVLDSLQYILNGDGLEQLFNNGRDFWQVRNLVGLPDFAGPLQAHRAAVRPLLPQRSATAP